MEARAVGQEGKQYYLINDEIGRVKATQLLIVGSTGSGKSVATNVLAHRFKWDVGATVVYCTEKPKGALENAYCAFPPQNEVHQRFASEVWNPEMICGEKIKIHHPMTFNAPFSRKLPPIYWFAFNIRDLDESSLSALFGMEIESNVVALTMAGIKKLHKGEGLWDLTYNIYNEFESEQGENYVFKESDLGMPVSDPGTRSTLETVKNGLSPLGEDYFVHDDTSPYLVDMVDVLNDNVHTHFFTTKYIKDERIKYFFQIMLLKSINEALGSGQVHHPVVLVLEEVKILLPVTTKTIYEQQLALYLRNMLSGLRNQGRGCSSIATTQSFFQTNREFRATSDEIFLFKTNIQDIFKLSHDMQLDKDSRSLLQTMTTGKFINLKAMEPNSYPDVFLVPLPPFAHKEEGDSDFFAKWRELRPQEMFSYNKLVDAVSLTTQEAITRVTAKYRRIFERKAFEKQKQEEGVRAKSKLEVMEEKYKTEMMGMRAAVEDKKRTEDDVRTTMLCTFVRDNPDESWSQIRMIAKRHGIRAVSDLTTMQKAVFKGLWASREVDLIRRKFSKGFLRRQYPDKFQIVYGVSVEEFDESLKFDPEESNADVDAEKNKLDEEGDDGA